MLKTETETIDGIEYQASQMTTTESLKLFDKIAPIIVEPMSHVMDKIDPSKGLNFLDMDWTNLNINEAAKALFMRIAKEGGSAELAKQILKGVTTEGRTINFDIDFAGKHLHLIKVIGFKLKVEYSSFFGEGGLDQLVQAVTTKSNSLQASKKS